MMNCDQCGNKNCIMLKANTQTQENKCLLCANNDGAESCYCKICKNGFMCEFIGNEQVRALFVGVQDGQ